MKLDLKKISIIIFGLSLVLQFIIVYFFNEQQVSDYKCYVDLAKKSVSNGEFYPSKSDLYSEYLWAPGFINYAALVIYLSGSVKTLLYLNIIFIGFSNIFLLKLCRRYFNHFAGNTFLILSSLYISNYGLILHVATETLFIFLVFFAVYLYTRNSTSHSIYAGLLLGLANWIRPFLPVYLLVFIIIAIYVVQNRRSLVPLFFGLMISILTIGTSSYISSGYFEFQSSTAGVNLIMGANDDADGSYNDEVFNKGKLGYLQNRQQLTYRQKNSIWKERAFNWIKTHPIEYIELMPKKLFYMYIHDFGWMSPLSGNMDYNAGSSDKIKSLLKSFPNLTRFQWALVWNQFYYGIILTFGLFGLIKIIKKKHYFGITLGCLWVLGTGYTIITVGGARYHALFIPLVIIFASFFISNLFGKRKSVNGF